MPQLSEDCAVLQGSEDKAEDFTIVEIVYKEVRRNVDKMNTVVFAWR